tara:strand:- start:352 stop:1008 length:657 start_codon:yes stop_codon:yes gene_type:complete
MKTLNHVDFLYKPKLEYIKNFAKKIVKLNILEFGVMHGRSTKMFLELCDELDGTLTSVDIHDHKNLFNHPKWNFIQSRDDNFNLLNKIQNKNFDIIYIDSLHEPNHIKKILYFYYKYLKVNGRVFIDDINWLPYVQNSFKESEYSEVINRKTFSKLLEVYFANFENIQIEFNFNGTGNANILKLNDHNLNEPKKIKNRLFGLRNILRKTFNINRKPKM